MEDHVTEVIAAVGEHLSPGQWVSIGAKLAYMALYIGVTLKLTGMLYDYMSETKEATQTLKARKEELEC